MPTFSSKPPSEAKPAPSGFFRGGMMPAAPMDYASLIVFDIRALKLSVAEGRELERELRETLFKMLDGRTKTFADRSAADLGGTVLGIAID
ncbi:hypothetical protein [Hoeflea olei]|uniref:Uncharacterized protein n=1 Tax=Hoeflea olei TaxID=1480615 RepID=A0A1C1YQU4_9HYPH|nr:hypothetical protein [Hoeflea olei]OCW55854.1 hypothetical protein AWJ14_15390 [Hoeflea olei]